MQPDPKGAWEAIFRLRDGLEGHHKNICNTKIRRPNGQLAKTDEESAEILKHFFSDNVFGRTSPYRQSTVDNLTQLIVMEELGEPPSLTELQYAIRKLKLGKAPGIDSLPPEAFKAMYTTSKSHLLHLLTLYWTNPEWDTKDWHSIILTLIPKSGDLSDPNKWRPISLLPIMSKLLSSIIAKRLDDLLQHQGLPEQSGFMSGRGTADANAALKITLQNLRNQNTETYVLFIDLVKAFDSVNREMMLQILRKFGIPVAMIAVIAKLYNDIKIQFTIGSSQATFQSTSGVKQGNNLAPILFLIVVQAAIQQLEKNGPSEPQTKHGTLDSPTAG